MKIAFLAPHLRNAGGIKILLTYANLLTKRGHSVTVFVRSVNPVRRRVANLLQLGKPDWLQLESWVERVFSYDVINFTEYDHVIAGGYVEAGALARADVNNGWYLIQHDEGLYHGPREEVDQVLQSGLHKIVVSSWLQEVVKDRTGQGSDLLLNPYDREQFYQVSSNKERDIVKILILDHTYSWKGTTEAISLVKKFKSKFPYLRLVGLGRRREPPEDIYDEYYFDPEQSTLRNIYSDIDIYLCTSWDEGFGLPSLEAMACGAAVVTYDNGGSRDFAFDGKTAFVAPRKSEKILEEKLIEAITQPEKRRQIATSGTAFVLTMPTWEDQVTKLEQLLLQR